MVERRHLLKNKGDMIIGKGDIKSIDYQYISFLDKKKGAHIYVL